MITPHSPITIAGAGLAGSLMAILLARRGRTVQVIEKRADPRRVSQSAGRSINLALADRGIAALRQAQVLARVEPLLIPMAGRCVHDIDGNQRFVPYGQRAHEVIYSVSRPGLNAVLLDAAEELGVNLKFGVQITEVDLAQHALHLQDSHGLQHIDRYAELIAADGYQSPVRHALLNHSQAQAHIDTLAHGYKELTLPANAQGQHQLRADALHIWPRGGFMLIALPNLDGSFTVTLFLSLQNPGTEPSFAELTDHHGVDALFRHHFADAHALMPDLSAEFLAHPTGHMATVRCPVWTDAQHVVLIGDAAHAIVPFHGQGMNCAFEDCAQLDALLATHSFAEACSQFASHRLPNAHAIADMALENYIEMRDTVRDPKFLLQKELSFALERRCPDHFIPRYSMVMFHHEISYAEAYARGKIQAQLLDELTRPVTSLAEMDMAQAEALVKQRLAPFTPQPR